MASSATLATVAVALALAIHDGTASGAVVGQPRTVPAFDAVALTGANRVTIDVGVPRSVTVYADRNRLERVTTRVQSGQLMIGGSPNQKRDGNGVRVVVDVPSLRAVTIDAVAAGTVSVSDARGDSFTVTLAGTGIVKASGITHDLEASLSGTGKLELNSLKAQTANVDLAGTGQISVDATSDLNARLTGQGQIQYSGSPTRVTKHDTGLGWIQAG